MLIKLLGFTVAKLIQRHTYCLVNTKRFFFFFYFIAEEAVLGKRFLCVKMRYRVLISQEVLQLALLDVDIQFKGKNGLF